MGIIEKVSDVAIEKEEWIKIEGTRYTIGIIHGYSYADDNRYVYIGISRNKNVIDIMLKGKCIMIKGE